MVQEKRDFLMVQMRDDEKAAIKAAAKEHGLTMSAFVRLIIKEALKGEKKEG